MDPSGRILNNWLRKLGLLSERGAAGATVRFLGNRSDIPLLLSSLDVLALTLTQ